MDIGCGYGFLLQKIKKRFSENIKLEVYGTDISQFMIENAKRNVTDGKFMICPAESLPFNDNHFENVVCSEVIKHVIDPKKTVAELSRVTSEGGNLIISTPNYSGYTFSVLRLINKYETFWPFGKLKSYLQKHTDFSVKSEDVSLKRLKVFLKENNLVFEKVIYLVPLAEQSILSPNSTNLWKFMVFLTKIFEKIPLINRVACNQIILIARKEKKG